MRSAKRKGKKYSFRHHNTRLHPHNALCTIIGIVFLCIVSVAWMTLILFCSVQYNLSGDTSASKALTQVNSLLHLYGQLTQWKAVQLTVSTETLTDLKCNPLVEVLIVQVIKCISMAPCESSRHAVWILSLIKGYRHLMFLP